MTGGQGCRDQSHRDQSRKQPQRLEKGMPLRFRTEFDLVGRKGVSPEIGKPWEKNKGTMINRK